MHEAKIVVEENAELLYNALKYENAPRCKVKYELKDGKFYVTILSKKLTNLRAAINSFLIWIDMLEKLLMERND